MATYGETFLTRTRTTKTAQEIGRSRISKVWDFMVWGSAEDQPTADSQMNLTVLGILNALFVRLGFLLTLDVAEDQTIRRTFFQRRYWKP